MAETVVTVRAVKANVATTDFLWLRDLVGLVVVVLALVLLEVAGLVAVVLDDDDDDASVSSCDVVVDDAEEEDDEDDVFGKVLVGSDVSAVCRRPICNGC